MAVFSVAGADGYAQLITVLIIFVAVLVLTALVTKWMANYQKQQSVNLNIEVLETTRISASKYIQLVRIGEKYMAIAVCKDTVTALCEIPKDQLRERMAAEQDHQFRELLLRAVKKDSGKSDESKD